MPVTRYAPLKDVKVGDKLVTNESCSWGPPDCVIETVVRRTETVIYTRLGESGHETAWNLDGSPRPRGQHSRYQRARLATDNDHNTHKRAALYSRIYHAAAELHRTDAKAYTTEALEQIAKAFEVKS